MTIKIHSKDCSLCQLFVMTGFDGGSADYDCLLRAYDCSKDVPGELCPGPGEYELVPVGYVKRMAGGFGTLAARCAGLENEVKRLGKENSELKVCLEGANQVVLSSAREAEALATKVEELQSARERDGSDRAFREMRARVDSKKNGSGGDSLGKT